MKSGRSAVPSTQARAKKWALPVRLMRNDPGHSALTALICMIAVLSSFLAVALLNQLDEELHIRTAVWPADVWIGRADAGPSRTANDASTAFETPVTESGGLPSVQSESATGQSGSPGSRTLASVTTVLDRDSAITATEIDEVRRVARDAGYAGLEFYPRSFAGGFLDAGGRPRPVLVMGVAPEDPVVTGSVRVTEEPIGTLSIGAESNGIQVVIPISFEELRSLPGSGASEVLLVDNEDLWRQVDLAFNGDRAPSFQSDARDPGRATHIVVAADHDQVGPADTRSLPFALAYDLNQLLQEDSLVARPWQEAVGQPRFLASSRVRTSAVALVASVAIAGILGAAMMTIQDRQDVVMTLRTYGFSVESIRFALARESLLTALAGSLVAAILAVALQGAFDWMAVDGGVIWRIALGGVILPPVVVLSFSGRPLRRSIQSLQAEILG